MVGISTTLDFRHFQIGNHFSINLDHVSTCSQVFDSVSA
jgi:hypothetical protein